MHFHFNNHASNFYAYFRQKKKINKYINKIALENLIPVSGHLRIALNLSEYFTESQEFSGKRIC